MCTSVQPDVMTNVKNTVLLETQGTCGSVRRCNDDTETHDTSIQGKCRNTPLVQCMFRGNYLTTSYNMVCPTCQKNSRTCQAACHCTPFLYDKLRAQGANVVTQSRISKLPMSSRLPGGSRKESTLHRSQSSHSILLVQLHRVERKFGEESTNHHIYPSLEARWAALLCILPTVP